MLSAAAFLLATTALYAYFFSSTPISDNPERWGQLGDYFGGTLNPLLSFISILLLTRSLNLQSETHRIVTKQFREEKKREVHRSFESKFLSLITPLTALDGIKIHHKNWKGHEVTKHDKDAIRFVEEMIDELEHSGATKSTISNQIEIIDVDDDIYEVVRRFYVCTKLITTTLSEENGFNQNDRVNQIVTMMNFTNIHKISLICISIKYLDTPPTNYLMKSSDFIEAAKTTALPIN